MNGNEVQSQIKELEKIQSQSRLWRLLTSLALVVIVAIGVGSIINAVQGLFQAGPRQEQFATALGANLKRDVVPQVQTIAQQSIGEIRPQVEKEFSKLNDRAPELASASLDQLETLQKNVPMQAEKVLEETFGKTMAEKEPKIKAMFPDATEEKIQTAVQNITDEAQERVMHAHDSLFSAHMTALNSIIGNLDTIQRTEKVNPHGEKADWEMGLAVFDLVHDEFKNLQPVSTGGKTTVGGKAGAMKGTKSGTSATMPHSAPKMNAPKPAMNPQAKPNAIKGAASGTKQPVGY